MTEDERNAAIEIGDAVQTLFDLPGWNIWRGALTQLIRRYQSELIGNKVLDDLNKVNYLRGIHVGLGLAYNLPGDLIQAAKQARENRDAKEERG